MLVADTVRIDRRSGIAAPPVDDREVWLAALQSPIEVGFDRIDCEVVAIRGDLLSLLHWTWRADTGDEIDFLGVTEVDEDGLGTGVVLFDTDDEAAALAELDRRHEEAGTS